MAPMNSDRRRWTGPGLIVAFGLWLLPASGSGAEALRVFACEPVWAALAEEIGGDRVRVHSATTAHQDVHSIQARPSLIAKLRRADLLVCSGADLEIGWLPVLLRQARNPGVQPGRPGNMEVASLVPMLGVPAALDRARGDVHPRGNPHTQMNPHNVARVANVLAQRLAELDPEGRDAYSARQADFSSRWSEAIQRWEKSTERLRGMEIVTHHLGWVYLADWLGLEIVAHLEPKPGIPPTAGHLAELLRMLSQRPVRAIVRAAYRSERPSLWLSERAKISAIVLPHSPGATPGTDDLFGMFDAAVGLLLEAAP